MKLVTNVLLLTSLLLGSNSVAQDLDVGHISSSTSDLSVVGTGSIYISGNVTITSTGIYKNDGAVEIKGNISNDKASMAPGAGTTSLTGTLSQTIEGAQPFSFYDVTINNTSSGASNIVLSKPIVITHSAAFTDGVINAGANTVSFANSAICAAVTSASYVNGLVEKVGNQAFTFPVGDGTKARTASISPPSSNTDVFTCKYFYTDAFTSGDTYDAGINRITNKEYWEINRTVGTSTPIVTLSYDTNYTGTIATLADLRIANLIGTLWSNRGGSGSGTLAIGTVTAGTASSTWGRYTLASSTTNNPLPIELLRFDATYNATKNGVDLSWATGTEKNSDHFIVERSLNSINWVGVLQQKAAGNSISLLQYEAFDGTPFRGTVFYRLKETDFNLEFAYSAVQSVSKNRDESTMNITPNPVTHTAAINFKADITGDFQVAMSNTLGQLVQLKTMALLRGENKIELDMEQLIPGNYFIKIYSVNSSKIKIQKIIKSN